MKVPFVDLSANYHSVQCEVDSAMEDVIADTRFIGGPPVEEFEASFAEYVDCDYAVAVNSGTDALRFALRAADVEKGEEVITVSHTWISSVDGIVHNGSRPRFVDVDPST
mgnify:CR=1 FL=1